MDATPPTPTRSPPASGAGTPGDALDAGGRAGTDRRDVDAARARRLISWPVLAVLLCVPGVLWALAGPLFSAPDEPSHAVKAVALWHGQLSGTDEVRPDGYLTTTFEIPAVWAQGSAFRECFAFQPDVTADCSPPFAGSESPSGADSTAGNYPPLFYVLVGWGGRMSDGPVGLYLMRITNAIVCGLLLAAGVRALARITDPRLALVGVLVAATPMAVFLAGSVNPNGLEIAAATAVWCTLLAILWTAARGEPLPRALVVQFAIAAATVALIRPLSPLFLAAIGLLALTSVPFTAVRRAVADRSVLVAVGVVALLSLAATAAIVSSGVLATGAAARIGIGTTNPVVAILGETDGYVAEMIGVFGWLDTRSPAFTLFAWLAATFVLVGIGVTLGSRRGAASLLAVLVATIVLPIVAQYPGAAANGLAWQGRYSLPIAVGIPILAVVVIGDRQRSLGDAAVARLTVGLAALTGAASTAAFFWTLRRYTTGASGSLRITSGAWQPPGGSALLVLAMAAVSGVAVAVVVLAGRTPTAGRTGARGSAPRSVG